MDNIKRYIDCYVPITTCTLRCHYCYIVQHGLFANKVPKLKYSAETVRKTLSKERLGGTCLINFCTVGETLISKELLEYVRATLTVKDMDYSVYKMRNGDVVTAEAISTLGMMVAFIANLIKK